MKLVALLVMVHGDDDLDFGALGERVMDALDDEGINVSVTPFTIPAPAWWNRCSDEEHQTFVTHDDSHRKLTFSCATCVREQMQAR
jgi:hypothetical protein